MSHNSGPPIKWPADAVDPSGADLAGPLRSLLEGLNLLETEDDKKKSQEKGNYSTPWSLQVITAGSFQLSKVGTALVATLGGGAAVWAAVKGFWISQHDPDRLAYIGAAALIVSVLAVAIAIIVHSDVMARAQATAAEYDARARSATAFLNTARPVTTRPRYLIKTRTRNDWQVINAFAVNASEGLVVQLPGGGQVKPKDIQAITSIPDWV